MTFLCKKGLIVLFIDLFLFFSYQKGFEQASHLPFSLLCHQKGFDPLHWTTSKV